MLPSAAASCLVETALLCGRFFGFVYVAAVCVSAFLAILDLRSGKQKSSWVPPPRPYRHRDMVVHTPTKLEVLRQTAAERRAANGDGAVPPSVAAAADAAARSVGDAATASTPAVVGDLMGDPDADLPADHPLAQDFAAWNGNVPPGIEVRAEVHERGQEQQVNSNVTTRRGFAATDGLTADRVADDDKISVAGSVSDVTPPPNSSQLPQLNPFTPEWFAQLVGTAASAAASAAVQAMASSTPSRPAPAPAATPAAAPRRLNERKIPDFWEDRPEFWFRIFDAHLAHFNPSEQQSFDTLLPLLTSAARVIVHCVIGTPGLTPYSRARDALLRHFGRTPRQLAREAREARSLGDKLPSEFLDHLMALLPDIKTFYEIALLDALPSNARVAALQHSEVLDMARAADAVVLESRAELESSRAVNALSLLDDELDGVRSMPPPLTPSPAVAALGRSGPQSAVPASREQKKKDASLCFSHSRWGKEAYRCGAPNTCRMRGVIKPRPPAVSGNGKAGGR